MFLTRRMHFGAQALLQLKLDTDSFYVCCMREHSSLNECNSACIENTICRKLLFILCLAMHKSVAKSKFSDVIQIITPDLELRHVLKGGLSSHCIPSSEDPE